MGQSYNIQKLSIDKYSNIEYHEINKNTVISKKKEDFP